MTFNPQPKLTPKTKKKTTPIKRTRIKYKPKVKVKVEVEGELAQVDIMLQIWEEREHISELTGKHLGDDMKVVYFAHILPKGRYPKYKLRKDNIMLVTFEEHFRIDHETHKAKADSNYNKFFERFEELKEEYHKHQK